MENDAVVVLSTIKAKYKKKKKIVILLVVFFYIAFSSTVCISDLLRNDAMFYINSLYRDNGYSQKWSEEEDLYFCNSDFSGWSNLQKYQKDENVAYYFEFRTVEESKDFVEKHRNDSGLLKDLYVYRRCKVVIYGDKKSINIFKYQLIREIYHNYRG